MPSFEHVCNQFNLCQIIVLKLFAIPHVCPKIIFSAETLRSLWVFSSSWASGHCEHGGQAAEWIGNHFRRAQKIKMCVCVTV